MNALDLQKIGREMSASRMNVPLQNRRKFDIESKDFFNAIGRAIRTGHDDRAAALLRQWETRVVWLTDEPRCFSAPPCLVREIGESREDYLNRCYDAERR